MTARRGLEWSDGAAGPVLNRERQDGPACRPEDDGLFFGTTAAQADRAKAICARCPVLAGCLRIALAGPSLEGVWGGTTREERAVMRGALRPARKPRRKAAQKGIPRGSLAERRERARLVLEAGEKRCAGRCGQVKPLDQFSLKARSLDGHQPECKDCRRVMEAHRRAEPAGRLPVAA